MTPELKDFNMCIHALALELPQSVWNDVQSKWLELQNLIKEKDKRIAELEEEVKDLRYKVAMLKKHLSEYDKDYAKKHGIV